MQRRKIWSLSTKNWIISHKHDTGNFEVEKVGIVGKSYGDLFEDGDYPDIAPDMDIVLIKLKLEDENDLPSSIALSRGKVDQKFTEGTFLLVGKALSGNVIGTYCCSKTTENGDDKYYVFAIDATSDGNKIY